MPQSAVRLSLAEREEISRGLLAGDSCQVIAARLGRAPSTVSRDVAAGGGQARYRAWRAEANVHRRARRLYDEAAQDGMRLSGIGADFHHVRVVIAVPSEKQRAWVEGRLARAAVPCGLVETEISGGVSAGRFCVEKRVR